MMPASVSQNPKRKTEPINLLFIDDEEGFVDIIAKRMYKRNIHVTKP